MNRANERLHWKLRRDAGDIAWLSFDKAGATSNVLSKAVLDELDAILAELEQNLPRGVVIKSAKTSGFIMGADVTEFGALGSAEVATRMAGRGQQILTRIERLRCPTVAAIDGYALGGGLELALACRYRVAVESYERTLGLPEVQLGIHPGFGGTVRMVELVGAPAALDLMLTGRSASPVEALKIGFVDRVVSADRLDEAAQGFVERPPARRRAAWYLRLLQMAPLRSILAQQVRKQVARRARKTQYPAPYALIDLWAGYGAKGDAAYRAEAESIGRLLVTATCKNLVRMFLLRERLRNLAPRSDAIKHVHVIGGGIMGGDIASWCALRGLQVSLQDRALEFVEPARKRAELLFAKRLRAPGAAAAAMQRLQVDIEGKALPDADLVLEAIVEKLDAKRALYADAEPRLKSGALLATNTSSIRIEDLAQTLLRPADFIGLHFFNPVAQLPLVEVIRGESTGDESVKRALSFVVQIGKLPLPCRSAPGFLVNRVLTPYMLEALRAHEDGHSLESIDAAAKAFGMPVGPVELADRVGLDVALSVAKIMSVVLRCEPPALLVAKVAEGTLGAKTGQGFYTYVDGKAQKLASSREPNPELADRLILPLVNEAVACLQEGVVEDADLVDAGVVFGTGFAPFTGGPINYARERGFREIENRLGALAEQFGSRFTPHVGWKQLGAEA